MHTAPTHLLTVLVWLPAIAGIFVLFLPRQQPGLLRAFGVLVGLFEFGKSLQLLIGTDTAHGFRFVENVPWIPALGIRYHLAVDGMSLWLVLLTTFLTPLTLYVSFGSVKVRLKEYIAAFLLLEAAMLGAFLALDMFLFYVFWELMLVPMYLIIGVFGGPNRVYAAIKFFLYTFLGSIFMLLAILFMVSRLREVSGGTHYSWDYADLMRLALPRNVEMLLFIAFAIAFAVKVPMFPLHTWLPDAHTEAPTGGSVILAAVMLKMGTYGFLRFALPFFPSASHRIGPTLAGLACAGILYGAGVAWRQRDFKKLIAYSSVSHLGFVMLGLAARTDMSVTGAILQMINHGISTGALFILVGVIYDRRHTRELAEFGGLAKVMPAYATLFVIVTMSSIGLPLTNGFVGEFLVITGSFTSTLLQMPYHCTGVGDGQRVCDHVLTGPMFGVFAALGVLFGAIYMLECVQRVFFGPNLNPKNQHLEDLNRREWTALVPLVFLIVLIGVKPELLTASIEPDVHGWMEQYNARHQQITDFNDRYRLLEPLTEGTAAMPTPPVQPPTPMARPAAPPRAQMPPRAPTPPGTLVPRIVPAQPPAGGAR